MVRSALTGARGALTAGLLLLALGGCVLPGGGGEGAAGISPITGPEVETTTLPPAGSAETVAAAGASASSLQASETTTEPASDPASEPTASAPEPAPPVVKSPAQIACEKLGGRLVRAGRSSAMACQRVMRDAGKSCRRKSDCAGECLARSGTCAPLAPLFGCNDVLQDDGRQVSLCLD